MSIFRYLLPLLPAACAACNLQLLTCTTNFLTCKIKMGCMVYNRAQRRERFSPQRSPPWIFFHRDIFPLSFSHHRVIVICDAIFELSQNEASMEFFHRYFSTLFKIKLINNTFPPSWNCNEIWVFDNKYRTSWPFWLGSKGWPLQSQYIAVQPAGCISFLHLCTWCAQYTLTLNPINS